VGDAGTNAKRIRTYLELLTQQDRTGEST